MVGYSPLLAFRANRLPDLLILVAYLSRPDATIVLTIFKRAHKRFLVK